MVSEKKMFLRFPIVSLREMMTPGRGLFRPQEHDWQDLCRVPLIIATHKIKKLWASRFKKRKSVFIFSIV